MILDLQATTKMQIAGLSVSDLYLWGVVGSLAVEVGAAVKNAADSDGVFPPKYTRWQFLTIRCVFAFFAGTVPLMLDATNTLTAFYLGASAPLVFDRAARGLEPPTR
jgi:hypothetical protein